MFWLAVRELLADLSGGSPSGIEVAESLALYCGACCSVITGGGSPREVNSELTAGPFQEGLHADALRDVSLEANRASCQSD